MDRSARLDRVDTWASQMRIPVGERGELATNARASESIDELAAILPCSKGFSLLGYPSKVKRQRRIIFKFLKRIELGC